MTGWSDGGKKKAKLPPKYAASRSRKVAAGHTDEPQALGASSKSTKPSDTRRVQVKPKPLYRSSSEGSGHLRIKQKEKEAKERASDYSDGSFLDAMSSWLSRFLGFHTTPHSMDTILPFVFLGNDHAASDLTGLRKAGITHVCNVAAQCDIHFPNDFHYLHLRLLDNPTQQLAKHLQAASEFIHRAKHADGRVLVHCVAGVSRSACVVVAYLLEHCMMPLVQAYAYVKRKRPVMCPSTAFRMQLALYEIALFESSSVLSSHDPDWDFYELNMYRQAKLGRRR
ncbi:hypothetical protein H310_01630 [Aphanomyces invadans]|uniref:protein-tyrosine-phosphatase n=1 Tax=Aphanomyces invadans TaxID=157072 RepID=A0A024UTF1_9STRA|nr:hypothetical protein H310_01630 [Aphanomyces invadans]ETW09207.1 hypothetical protein H310_01630 [Aphanomyces invadans]|eukprot:XP_008863012.1 hypothetical protein H310_01630 [Aphanomyces invadans]